MGINQKYMLYGAAALLAYAVLTRKNGESVTYNLGQTVGGAVVDATTGIVKGAVIGIGSAVGIPETDAQKCKDCIQRGDNYGASKYCSAGVFAKWQYLSMRKRITGQNFSLNDVFN